VINLNAEPYTIIGVAGRGFAFPRGSEMPGDFQFAAVPDVWVPLKPPTGGITDLAIVGRLRAGVTEAAARQDMDRVMAVVRRTVPVIKNSRPDETLVPLREQLVGGVEQMLISLLAGVVLVLTIACVNTAQLLLAQLHSRRPLSARPQRRFGHILPSKAHAMLLRMPLHSGSAFAGEFALPVIGRVSMDLIAISVATSSSRCSSTSNRQIRSN